MEEFASYIIKAVISALAGVGLMEWLKNFIKTSSLAKNKVFPHHTREHFITLPKRKMSGFSSR